MSIDNLFNDHDSYLEKHYESQYDEDRYVDTELINIIHRLELLGEEYPYEETPF